MASALLEVVSNAGLRKEMSARSVLQAKKFHRDVIDRKIVDLWSELTEGKQPSGSGLSGKEFCSV